jgi:hypothetical protein
VLEIRETKDSPDIVEPAVLRERFIPVKAFFNLPPRKKPRF